MDGNLNLNQLRAFYYAASCGSVTLASEKLFITQPAVSMQIKALENQYGTTLFIRGKKRLELTERGKQLYRVARGIFDLVAEAEEVLIEAGGLQQQILKIGSTKTLVRHLLAESISGFQKSHPKLQIRIYEGSSEDMVRSVMEDHIDLAIVGRVEYSENLEVFPFLRDELVLLAAPTHPLCEREEVEIADLGGHNLILREKGSGTRLLIEKVFAEAGMVSSGFVETANVDFIKELVRMGNGITLLARMGVDDDVSKGHLKIIPLKGRIPSLYIDIVTKKGHTLSSADKTFLNILTEDKSAMSAAL